MKLIQFHPFFDEVNQIDGPRLLEWVLENSLYNFTLCFRPNYGAESHCIFLCVQERKQTIIVGT
jgi:hypothetical protein